MSSSSPGTSASSGSDVRNLTNSISLWSLTRNHLYLSHALSWRLPPRRAAACVRSAARPPPWKTPSSFHCCPCCINPSRVVALFGVRWCRFRLVSVSAHPACGQHGGNHKGHGRHLSRFVQGVLFLASAARRFIWRRCPCLWAIGLHRWPLTQACRGVAMTRY